MKLWLVSAASHTFLVRAETKDLAREIAMAGPSINDTPLVSTSTLVHNMFGPGGVPTGKELGYSHAESLNWGVQEVDPQGDAGILELFE